MATFLNEESKTYSEFLLIPRLTQKVHQPENVNLKTSLVRFEKGKKAALTLDIPLAAAMMQSVSDDKLAIALGKQGGIAFIYASQPIAEQAKMVANAKKHGVQVGAAINTRDYKERIAALVKAGADIAGMTQANKYGKTLRCAGKISKKSAAA